MQKAEEPTRAPVAPVMTFGGREKETRTPENTRERERERKNPIRV